MSLTLLFLPRGGGTTITGTGALAAQAASVDGTGNLGLNGTGALAAQASSVSGTGNLGLNGTGVLVADVSTISGTGVVNTIITGTGALVAGAASVSGTNITETPAAGGGRGWKGRTQRKFANINGNLIEVASYQEAEELFLRLRKTDEKPKRRRVKLKFQTGKYVEVLDSPSEPLQLKEIRAMLDHVQRQEDDELLMLLLSL